MKYPGTNRDWFVVGFAISKDSGGVLLIEKKKSWCKGLWNGVGGSVEPTDGKNLPLITRAKIAMRREFEEETGLQTNIFDWEYYCSLDEPLARVDFFRMDTTHQFLMHALTLTDEAVGIHHHSLAATAQNMMPNLCWLIPMARCKEMVHAAVEQVGGQYDGVR